jgi:uncharacterized protein (DUF1778 family)
MATTNVKKTGAKATKSVGRNAAARIPQSQNAEQSRLNFRLAPTVKERVMKAAALSGQDLTEFAVATLSEKANLVIEQHDNVLLGSEEHEFFLKALADPTVSEPSERSRKAAEKYRQGTRKGVRYSLAD